MRQFTGTPIIPCNECVTGVGISDNLSLFTYQSLQFTYKKTKVLSITEMDTFKVGGKNIEVVQYLNLLGSVIDEDGGSQRKVTRRLALGRAAMSGLQRVWKDRSLSFNNTKARLVKALVFLVWVRDMDTGESKKKQDPSLRNVVLVPDALDTMDYEEVKHINNGRNRGRDVTGSQGITKLTYLGHVVRSDGLEKTFMFGMGNGKRGRGQPRRKWMDEVGKTRGLQLQQLKEPARERVRWRDMVRVVTRGSLRPGGTR